MVPFVSRRVVTLTASDAIRVLEEANPLTTSLSLSTQQTLTSTGVRTLHSCTIIQAHLNANESILDNIVPIYGSWFMRCIVWMLVFLRLNTQMKMLAC